jgi:predicted PolB exonuclease-like 3'-5' exonuclease
MGVSRFLKEKNPAIRVIGAQPEEGSQIPGIRKWPEAYLPKIYDPPRVDRDRAGLAGGRRGDGAAPRAEEGIFAAVSRAARASSRCASRESRERDDRLRRLRPWRPLPVDRRLPGVAPMTPILVFDIETVPDLAGLRRTHDSRRRSRTTPCSTGIAQRRRAQTGGDFVPLHFSASSRSPARCATDGVQDRSVGTRDDPEPELIRRFFDSSTSTRRSSSRGTAALRPAGAELSRARPRRDGGTVLGLGRRRPRVQVQQLSRRYHTRHIDLMDVLAMYQPRGGAGAAAMARLCGFPGKLGMDGSAVDGAVRAGKLDEVRRYCETDVLNTYLVYQRFRLLRGEIEPAEYASEISIARERIAAIPAPHWAEFIAAWDANVTP